MTGRTTLRLFLALLITYGSMSFGQIERNRGTGIEGVITVSPAQDKFPLISLSPSRPKNS